MGIDDKTANAREKAAGKAREVAGRVTGDDAMAARGRREQGRADAKQAGEKLKDAVRDVTDR